MGEFDQKLESLQVLIESTGPINSKLSSIEPDTDTRPHEVPKVETSTIILIKRITNMLYQKHSTKSFTIEEAKQLFRHELNLIDPSQLDNCIKVFEEDLNNYMIQLDGLWTFRPIAENDKVANMLESLEVQVALIKSKTREFLTKTIEINREKQETER